MPLDLVNPGGFAYVMDSDGQTTIIELRWDKRAKFDWSRRKVSPNLSEMVYTILGSSEKHRERIATTLYERYHDMKIWERAGSNSADYTGTWIYEVSNGDMIRVKTEWIDPSKYGLSVWINDESLRE